MAIIGMHALLYTSEPEAVRGIFRDVFGWSHVDDGDGWLIFALPPSELGVHPAEGPTFDSGTRHQLTLMCDDITATVDELRAKGVNVRGEPQDEGFGRGVRGSLHATEPALEPIPATFACRAQVLRAAGVCSA